MLPILFLKRKKGNAESSNVKNETLMVIVTIFLIKKNKKKINKISLNWTDMNDSHWESCRYI